MHLSLIDSACLAPTGETDMLQQRFLGAKTTEAYYTIGRYVHT